MAVSSGFVGSSAKKETGKEFMSEARKELRLSPNGWMSEMVGKSTEVRFVNTVNRTQASIHELMGSPTVPNIYVFENRATISAATQSGWALQTGTFPAGSTLKIVNSGAIRGGGGNGGGYRNAGHVGGSALVLNFPTTIDNTTGTIWGGGGGGGGNAISGGGVNAGGGGAGIPAGNGGAGGFGDSTNGKAGSATTGGAGGTVSNQVDGGRGGNPGMAGGGAGGRGGYSVQTNGNAVTWIAVGERKGAVV